MRAACGRLCAEQSHIIMKTAFGENAQCCEFAEGLLFFCIFTTETSRTLSTAVLFFSCFRELYFFHSPFRLSKRRFLLSLPRTS